MRRSGAVLALLSVAVGSTLAHSEHVSHSSGPDLLPPAVFLGGVLVGGTALVLDHRGELNRRLADFGVALGALGVLAGIGLLFL